MAHAMGMRHFFVRFAHIGAYISSYRCTDVKILRIEYKNIAIIVVQTVNNFCFCTKSQQNALHSCGSYGMIKIIEYINA